MDIVSISRKPTKYHTSTLDSGLNGINQYDICIPNIINVGTRKYGSQYLREDVETIDNTIHYSSSNYSTRKKEKEKESKQTHTHIHIKSLLKHGKQKHERIACQCNTHLQPFHLTAHIPVHQSIGPSITISVRSIQDPGKMRSKVGK